MPTKRRIDVMLSSTSKDLPDHREQATNGILRLRHLGMYPVVMEALGVRMGDAIAESLHMVDESEIYIGIFGHRYGYIPDDPRNPDRISITEMEYRRALERDMPILIFIMDDEHPGPKTAAAGETFYEQEPEGKAKLKKLKAELMKKYVVAFFKSPEDLRGLLIQGLNDPDVIARAQAIAGTTVTDDAPTPPTAGPLPEPPALYADPPYTLTQTFVGRTHELRLLDDWARGDDPLMIVEAIGGMGKSALTWHWVETRARAVLDLDGIIWWSFYERGATLTAFLRHALAYLTRTDPDALKDRDPRDLLRRLTTELSRGRYLLALDGFERALVAYHRWNAAQMRDDKIEDAESIIRDRHIRACTDPKDDDALRALLSCASTRTLISSRLLPLALEDRSGNLSDGVKRIHLNGLHPDDALALVCHAGVTVDDTGRFAHFVKTFGGHSLLVKLVAGRVLKFRRARGDFDAWYNAEGRDLTVSDYDLRQNQTGVLQYAFDGLDPEAMRFLSQIAAFGDAVPYDTLALFNPFVKSREYFKSKLLSVEQGPPKGLVGILASLFSARTSKELTHERVDLEYDAYLKSAEHRRALSQFDDLLTELEERGLLRWDRATDVYDMHPVVRGTAFDRLEDAARAPTFARIRGHFEARPEDVNAAREVSDLANTIGVYRALIGAGQLDEAARFFRIYLEVKLHRNISAYYTVIELLEPLFPDGTDTLPRLSDAARQSSILTTMAAMFAYVGRRADALTLFGLALKVDLDRGDSANLIIGLQNLSNSLKDEGRLAQSEGARRLALALAEVTEGKREFIYSTLYLLGIYKDTGQWAEADAAYAALRADPPEPFWQADVEKYHAETLIYRGLDAGAALDRAEALAVEGGNALSVRQIKGWRGEVSLLAGDYDAATRWFEESVQLYRKSGSSFTGWVLGGLARACALRGDHARARAIIEENDFDDNEIINVAEVYHLIGEHDTARDYALRAYKTAWADGPPYVFWWHLERAKAVLDALGVAHPVLPDHNPNNVGPFPHEEAVRAYIDRLKGKQGGA